MRLVRTLDGDSFEARDRSGRTWRVRVAGIDAPEARQPHGDQARALLDGWLRGRDVVLRVHKQDVYERLVADVMVDGRDVGLALLEAGAAWHFRRYAHEQDARQRLAYAGAEREARASGRGLWNIPMPEPPWDYRARRRRTDS